MGDGERSVRMEAQDCSGAYVHRSAVHGETPSLSFKL